MEKVRRLLLLVISLVFFTLLGMPSAFAEYYVVYNRSDGFCCGTPPVISCCSGNCGYYFEYHAKRARSPDWAGRAEYAWIPDPADP